MSVMQSPPGPYTVIDGRRYLYFVGTGYLGLQGHPEVIRAACEAAQQYGMGSATARPGFGTTPPVLDVERGAAALLGAEDAFYFASGYAGNSILVEALRGTFDIAMVDELAHYAIVDAVRHVGLPMVTFRHCDPQDLRAKLRSTLTSGQRPLVASDGVFAARGTIAPLAAYWEVLGKVPGSALMIDDAHALGVLGANGRGAWEYAGLERIEVNGQPPVDPHAAYGCATLSKAVGGFGGIIAGSRAFVEYAKRCSPWYFGASALPAPVAAATARALEILAADPGLRTRLWENVGRVKSGLRRVGLETDDTPVPIVCLTLGTAENMRRIQQRLMEREILVAYMAAYAGLGPQGALRLAVFATHTDAMIQELLDQLQRIL